MDSVCIVYHSSHPPSLNTSGPQKPVRGPVPDHGPFGTTAHLVPRSTETDVLAVSILTTSDVAEMCASLGNRSPPSNIGLQDEINIIRQ